MIREGAATGVSLPIGTPSSFTVVLYRPRLPVVIVAI
jgi:hypothetical protein